MEFPVQIKTEPIDPDNDPSGTSVVEVHLNGELAGGRDSPADEKDAQWKKKRSKLHSLLFNRVNSPVPDRASPSSCDGPVKQEPTETVEDCQKEATREESRSPKPESQPPPSSTHSLLQDILTRKSPVKPVNPFLNASTPLSGNSTVTKCSTNENVSSSSLLGKMLSSPVIPGYRQISSPGIKTELPAGMSPVPGASGDAKRAIKKPEDIFPSYGMELNSGLLNGANKVKELSDEQTRMIENAVSGLSSTVSNLVEQLNSGKPGVNQFGGVINSTIGNEENSLSSSLKIKTEPRVASPASSLVSEARSRAIANRSLFDSVIENAMRQDDDGEDTKMKSSQLLKEYLLGKQDFPIKRKFSDIADESNATLKNMLSSPSLTPSPKVAKMTGRDLLESTIQSALSPFGDSVSSAGTQPGFATKIAFDADGHMFLSGPQGEMRTGSPNLSMTSSPNMSLTSSPNLSMEMAIHSALKQQSEEDDEHRERFLYKCKDCGASFRHAGSLKVHERGHNFEKKQFQCDICGKVVTDKSYLTIHMRTHQKEKIPQEMQTKIFECVHCRKRFSVFENYQIHIRTHTGEKLYKCEVCDTGFTRNTQLLIHMRIHTGERPYECQYCHMTFRQKGGLKLHMTTHTIDKPYKCDICETSFGRKAHLDKHRRYHTGERPFKCEICSKDFIDNSNLYQHMKNTHKEVGPEDSILRCPDCSAIFKRESTLREHMKSHSGDTHKCGSCDKEFTKKSYLQVHVRRNHMNEVDQHTCSICGKSFLTKNALQGHFQCHAGNAPFSCDICGHGCVSKQHLLDHKQEHRKHNQMYKCKICGHEYRLWQNLQRHILTEHDKDQIDGKTLENEGNKSIKKQKVPLEKTHKCESCNKVYSHKKNLIKHIEAGCKRKGSGKVGDEKKEEKKSVGAPAKFRMKSDSRHECHLCGNSYARLQHLNRHMKASHRNELAEEEKKEKEEFEDESDVEDKVEGEREGGLERRSKESEDGSDREMEEEDGDEEGPMSMFIDPELIRRSVQLQAGTYLPETSSGQEKEEYDTDESENRNLTISQDDDYSDKTNSENNENSNEKREESGPVKSKINIGRGVEGFGIKVHGDDSVEDELLSEEEDDENSNKFEIVTENVEMESSDNSTSQTGFGNKRGDDEPDDEIRDQDDADKKGPAPKLSQGVWVEGVESESVDKDVSNFDQDQVPEDGASEEDGEDDKEDSNIEPFQMFKIQPLNG